jgi:MinD-like ATPase involved in chromosome partitioning or flagellar assembly
VSEQDWQVTLLTELGIPLSGLMASDPAGRPLPSPVVAEGHAPTGRLPLPPAGQEEDALPLEDVSVIGRPAVAPAEPAERTAADPFGDQSFGDRPDVADQPVIVQQPVIGAPVQDDRSVPFGDERAAYPPAPPTAAEPTDQPVALEPPAPSWEGTRGRQPVHDQVAPPRPDQESPAPWQHPAPEAEPAPPPPRRPDAPPQAEQGSAGWEQAGPQAEQSPGAWEQAAPQAEQGPAGWEQAAPQVEQAAPQAEQSPPAWEQAGPQVEQAPPAWEQVPPGQEEGGPQSWEQGGQPSWAQEVGTDPEYGPSPRPDASPQWEQGTSSVAEQDTSIPPWEPSAQVGWDEAVQPAWGAGAPHVPGPPEQEGPHEPPAGSEAWRQESGDPPQPPVSGSAAPGPPPTPGPPQVGPPVTGGPIAARDLVRRSAYGDPLVRRMSRGMRRAMGAAAAGDVRKAADVEAVLGRPVPSCRQIAVTSIRGGAGKTTVAGLTATVIAQYRQDRVLALDADSGLGSLPLRMGVGPQRSLHDLSAAHPRSFEETSRYLALTADGLWVLSGTAGGRIAGELDLATYRSAAGVMSRYFAATVVDCGAGLLPELQRGIMADAHAQVMVTPGTVDGALSAHGALEWQARNGYEHLLPRTVIAFVTHTPHVDADLARAAQMLSSGGLPVVHIPYDRHLAAGTAVESARIGHETRAAVIRIAVEAFARAVAA